MSENNLLDWNSERLLTWNDFQADPNPAPYQNAFSKIQYSYTWTLNSEKMGKDVFFFIEKINLTTQFLKHLSWVRFQFADELLLRHQQGIFDLAEELRPKIEESLLIKLKHKRYPAQGKNEAESKQFAKEYSGVLIKTELDKLFDDLLLAEIKRYEQDTNYGENLSKQTQYDERFQRLRN